MKTLHLNSPEKKIKQMHKKFNAKYQKVEVKARFTYTSHIISILDKLSVNIPPSREEEGNS